jgi:hypothetical protein
MKVLLIAQGASVTLHADGTCRDQAEALRAPSAAPSLGSGNVLCSLMIVVQARLYRCDGGSAQLCCHQQSGAGVMQRMSTGGGEGCCALAPGVQGAQDCNGQPRWRAAHPLREQVNAPQDRRRIVLRARRAHECKSSFISFVSPGANARLQISWPRRSAQHTVRLSRAPTTRLVVPASRP